MLQEYQKHYQRILNLNILHTIKWPNSEAKMTISLTMESKDYHHLIKTLCLKKLRERIVKHSKWSSKRRETNNRHNQIPKHQSHQSKDKTWWFSIMRKPRAMKQRPTRSQISLECQRPKLRIHPQIIPNKMGISSSWSSYLPLATPCHQERWPQGLYCSSQTAQVASIISSALSSRCHSRQEHK